MRRTGASSLTSATTGASARTRSPARSRTTARPPGHVEDNGTSIVDVTDPKRPRYLHHIPGAAGEAEAGGAAMVRVCDGKTLPRADKDQTYTLRPRGDP